MQYISIEEQSCKAALEQISEQIALEALSVTSVINRVADLIPDLVHSAKMFLSEQNKDKPTLTNLDVNPNTLAKALTPTTFTNIASLNHPIPPGFKGNLYEYTTVLNKSLSFASDTPSIITDFNVFLSKMISNEQARKTIKTDLQVFRDRAKQRKELINATSVFFSAGSRINNAKYGDIISSNAQYLAFIALVQETIIVSTSVKIKDVESLIKDCHELLTALGQMGAENKLAGLSPEMLETIGIATESVAKDIEFYSLNLFALSALREAAQNGAQSLIKALRY